ncbi:hypothetical protein CSPX01_12553 [Colletotrichum filicis]|nr:hypothetical protein CSPX01_12553 [Colletotrichum filicis]
MKPRHMNGTSSQRAGRLSVFLGIVSVPSIKFQLPPLARVASSHTDGKSILYFWFHGISGGARRTSQLARCTQLPIRYSVHAHTPARCFSSQVPTRPAMHRGSVRALGMTASLAVP